MTKFRSEILAPAAEIRIRRGTVDDTAVLAHQRASMFREMGRTDDASYAKLIQNVQEFFLRAVPAGEYLAWLAHTADNPANVVAGAGVVVRQIPPFPMTSAAGEFSVAEGRQALVQNVYTEPAWRRKGIAKRMMNEIIEWSEQQKIESLILHASIDGRPLYEQLGFRQTNEMVYRDPRGR